MSDLLKRFEKYRDQFGVPIIKTAELCDIESQRLYRFSNGKGNLINDEVIRLHNHLLTYEAKK